MSEMPKIKDMPLDNGRLVWIEKHYDINTAVRIAALPISEQHYEFSQLAIRHLEAKIRRVRELVNQQPLYSARQNPELMKGWRLAMRQLIDTIDGDGAWTNYPQIHEDGEQS